MAVPPSLSSQVQASQTQTNQVQPNQVQPQQPQSPRVTLPALAGGAAEAALIQTTPPATAKEGISPSSPECRLPVELDVVVPVRDFRVRNLLALETGEVIESQWSHGEDLPLASGDVVLVWTEFEVVDRQLAVRVTRLA